MPILNKVHKQIMKMMSNDSNFNKYDNKQGLIKLNSNYDDNNLFRDESLDTNEN